MDPVRKPGPGVWRPLQIESLRRDLPDSPRTDELLQQLQRFRENVDAVVFALTSRELAEDRRQHLLDILQRHREAFEACLAELGITSPSPQPNPLWHFARLDDATRAHLTAILGVPNEPPFYEVLDIKAQEYLAQVHAFEVITATDGFSERSKLSKDANRGALVLTLSGSLIQLSAPTSSGGRRYIYQNIYGNAHPPEGILVLDRDISVSQRIRSVELTTSPVRLLRVAGRRMSWKAQSRTFTRIARTFVSLSSEEGPLGDNPRDGTVPRAFSPKAAERVLLQEYGETFSRFERLRKDFSAGEGDQKAEAELLTMCHYLQTAARELGFEAAPIDQISDFVSVSGARYLIDRARKSIIQLPGNAAPEVVYPLASIGRQLVTCRAPLALISIKGGGLVDIVGPVGEIKKRSS